MSINPQLSTYIRFFQILSELERDNQISAKQKQHLKVNLTLKDPQLVNMIALNLDAEDEDIKYSVLSYLNQNTVPKNILDISIKKARSQSSVLDISPLKKRGDRPNSREKKRKDVNDDEIMKQISKLNDMLLSYQQMIKTEQSPSEIVIDSIGALVKVSQRVQSIAQAQSPLSQFSKNYQEKSAEIVSAIKQDYRQIKQNFINYMRSHILLMDENMSYGNLFKLLKEFVFHLVGCEQFSFCLEKDGKLDIYQTQTDAFQTEVLEDEIRNEFGLLEPNVVTPLDQLQYYPQIGKLIQNEQYQRSYLIKTYSEQYGNLYFAFHQHEGKQITKNFLSLANDYFFYDTVHQLVLFLVETVKQARVQFFSPMSIADMIQDLGLAFVRCSKYLLIDRMCQAMSQKFAIDKLISNPYQMARSFSMLGNKPQRYQEIFTIYLKDTLDISINVRSMDLGKPNDQMVHAEFIQTYDKYLGFIKQCYDTTAYYKFFLRSSDLLIFEFDKKGMLSFLSHPIPKSAKDSFKITLTSVMIQTGQLNYRKIFEENGALITNIETYLQQDARKWKIQKEDHNNPYEVFMKTEEKSFKGFVVIFQDSQKWVKNQQQSLNLGQTNIMVDENVKRQLRKSVLHQQTMSFLDNLERNLPDVRSSQVSMFMPQTKSQFSTGTSSPFSMFAPSPINQPRKSTQGRRSQLLIVKPIVPLLDVTEFKLNDERDKSLDNFEFNILEVSNPTEKARLVWALLKRAGFIEDFNIPNDELSTFLRQVMKKYNHNNNPFHNFDHGVTVMQQAYKICQLVQTVEVDTKLDQFTQFAMVISALCHDVDHTGRTNMFEMNSLSKLAIRYHDKSVLEQHHAATAISILQEDDSNILVNLSEEQFRKFRKLMISNILSTDITEHFKMVKEFETRLKERNIGQSEEDVKLVSGFIIHTSDFAGAVKSFPVSREWSTKVNLEFSAQYQEEGKLGYPQLPYMKNLDQVHVMAKGEMGFQKVIVRPLYDLMNQYLQGELEVCLRSLDDSIIQWEMIHNKALQEMQEQKPEIILEQQSK